MSSISSPGDAADVAGLVEAAPDAMVVVDQRG